MNRPAPPLDLLATPLAWTDAAGVIRDCTPAFASWLGVSRRRLPGQPLAALEVGSEMLAVALGLADARASTRDPRDESDTAQPLADADAALPPQRLRRIALQVPGVGRPVFADLWLSRMEEGGWLLEVHPVDEFPRQDGDALSAAVAAALKGLAHELRNPLAGIKGAAQLLARRAPDDAAQELTSIIQSEVDRLAALLDRLMSPQPKAPHAPLNMHAVLERVLRLAESDAGWAVRLVRDYDPSLPEFDGDADRLSQAVWNLVRNAIEAGATQVQLRTRAEHGTRIADIAHPLVLRLDIVDDGPGVPEELAERVFLPLVSGRADGSGLGLALAQQVAREHRGSVSYRSRPGHTVFSVLLPLQEMGDGG